MALIAVSCPHEATSLAYAEALAPFDVVLRHLDTAERDTSSRDAGSLAGAMGEAQALLIGGGPDIEANGSEAHMSALRQALAMDVPVLAIGSGMQLLNLAFGGQLLDSVPEHAPLEETSLEGNSGALRHQVYVTPGSKLSAILGPGGFFRVNSWHRRGLREAQRAPRLLTSAYSLEDGVVEAVESPAHDWVIGVQFQPERTGETPRAFSNLFTCFVQRIEPRQT